MIDQNEQLSHIKKLGEKDRISKEEFERRILEIAKCKRDICYFAEKYFRIINLDVGLTIIKLYPKQKELLDFFVKEKRCLTLASRQTGKCVVKDTKITVRNRETGEIEELTIEEFYSRFPDKTPDALGVKFVDSCRTAGYEILTDGGWKACAAVHKTVKYAVWRVVTETH